ncbi:MAG: helix-turn-helix transcriptional regulator [Planctomycetaceae bacterium]|nr:helix-turn-helix transcriptional regulator [Planctomycetaceae bacterium]
MADQIESELLRGSLDLMVLSVLAQSPKYGYLLQKALSDNSQQQIKLSAGTMYPLLHRLEEAGLVSSRWDETTGRRRKWYELTAKGRKKLVKQAELWQQYASCITRLLNEIQLVVPASASAPAPAPQS